MSLGVQEKFVEVGGLVQVMTGDSDKRGMMTPTPGPGDTCLLGGFLSFHWLCLLDSFFLPFFFLSFHLQSTPCLQVPARRVV